MSSGKKILLVDDDRLVLESLSAALEASGYQVWTTDSAEGAVSLAEEVQPDVVVTDYRMPGMDGVSLLSRLKKLARRPKMVVYSAEPPRGPAVERVRELSWVAKVPGHRALLEALEHLLGGEVGAQ